MQYPSTDELWRGISRAVWNPDISALPLWRARFLRWVRLVYLVGRDLMDGQLNLQAMSLVYTTLLSLVPLLAVSFSVLKAFDVHNQIEPIMLNFMTPLGEKGAQITANVIGFVDNIKVGVLGAVGLGLLIYTVVSLVQKIERAFNFTWRVSHGRSFVERFRDYLSVIMIGPVLLFSALGATASLMNNSMVQLLVQIPLLAWVVESIGAFVPYLFVIAAFTFVYKFVPNTRVRLSSAVVGALVAGFLWQTIGWGFASFVVTSGKYTAIYSGFAILIFFMIWLYLAWLILLVGASIAFYHQHPEYLTPRHRDAHLSNRQKERLGLSIIYLITRSHLRGTSHWTAEGLAKHLAVPTDTVLRIIALLEAGGMVIAAGEDPFIYLPAQAPERVALKAVLDTIRSGGESSDATADQPGREQAVDSIFSRMDRAVDTTLQGITLRELCMETSPPEASAVACDQALEPGTP